MRVRPDVTHRLYPPLDAPAAVSEEREAEDASAVEEEAPAAEDLVSPHDAGTAGAHYSSQRLVPISADRAYPYRAVGKLFFTIPGAGDASCSAAVLRPRIILTAGHCVHSGSGGASGFFTNFLFVPAYRNGTAPYSVWNWSRLVVTGLWASGGGLVPNAADYAIIELQDQTINSVLSKIGEVTGYLGYRTNSLHPNHAHLLGYPSNLNRGERLRQVTAQSFRATTSNTVEYGSNMRQGSSGGPWVQNFAGQCGGTNCGVNAVSNAIIGVTSYGPVATAPKYQGSSVLDNNFLNILTTACGWQAGNC
jgi:V8-like Glu-specific endopeptidase